MNCLSMPAWTFHLQIKGLPDACSSMSHERGLNLWHAAALSTSESAEYKAASRLRTFCGHHVLVNARFSSIQPPDQGILEAPWNNALLSLQMWS